MIGGTLNGLHVAAVGYGFGSHEELMEQAPTYHFQTMADLREAFAQH